jgi:hypothetical protein
MNDYEAILKAYELAGGDSASLQFPQVGSLVVERNRILSFHQVEGLIVEPKPTQKGIKAKIVVKKDYKIKNPVHLCFGVIPKEGIQEIIMEIILEDNSYVKLLAHCTFPNAVKVKHIMQADINIGRGAHLTYEETHYHGLSGGIEVIPRARISIASRGRLTNSFTLVKGKVGKLSLDYDVKVDKEGIAELITKVYGQGKDKIAITEKASLNGENAKSLIKSRTVVIDKAQSKVIGETYGNAPGAKGHVDCVEIVEGEAEAEAIPRVSVTNDQARVTHEAAIGRIDKRQLETLMARGLEESEAIDTVIKGILK